MQYDYKENQTRAHQNLVQSTSEFSIEIQRKEKYLKATREKQYAISRWEINQMIAEFTLETIQVRRKCWSKVKLTTQNSMSSENVLQEWRQKYGNFQIKDSYWTLSPEDLHNKKLQRYFFSIKGYDFRSSGMSEKHGK